MWELEKLQEWARPALQYAELVTIARYAPSAKQAKEQALVFTKEKNLGEGIAKACRWLMIIQRDYGRDAQKAFIASAAKRGKKMKVRKTPIKVETTPIVIGHNCPLHRSSYMDRDRIFLLETIKGCPYFYEEEGTAYLAWQEYSPKEVKSASDHEPSDGYAMPSSTYFWTIDCFSCTSKVRFSSGYSALCAGDRKECPKCKTLHTFVGSDRGKWSFAVPVRKQ